MSSESDGSDTELDSASPEQLIKKPPTSSSQQSIKADQNKKSSKIMVQEALQELKSRKGVSFYAIKKYITDNYNVNTDKMKHLLKKQIRTGVEDGTILQTKGTGASGSFKLVPTKIKNTKSKTAQKTNQSTKSATNEKKEMYKIKKTTKETKKPVDKINKTATGAEAKAEKEKIPKIKTIKPKSKSKDSSKATRGNKKLIEVIPKDKAKRLNPGLSKATSTPSKKKAMMKRKSIGSIIKPPKMRPKAK